MRWYVGIDLGAEVHQICVVDAHGKVIEEIQAKHDGKSIDQAIMRILAHGQADPALFSVGLEVPHGAVVDALLDHGLAVFAINPKQLDRFRDRYSPSGAKDDRRDAFVLANALRTDGHSFRRVDSEDAQIIALRELVRIDNELISDFPRQSNRLRAVLHRYYIQVLELKADADEAWIWDLLEAAPTPARAKQLRRARVERILKRHRIRRLSVEEVLSTLRQPALRAQEATIAAAQGHVALLLPRLRLLHQQRLQIKKQIAQHLAQFQADGEEKDREHRDLDILLSFPGLGNKTAATMLAEASPALGRRDYHTLRIRGGLAPVTRASGKSRQVVMRQACNKRLRNALYHWALASLALDAWAKAYYHRQRERGHSHGRALRGLIDRQLQTMTAMLRDGTLYDADRRLERHGHQEPSAA